MVEHERAKSIAQYYTAHKGICDFQVEMCCYCDKNAEVLRPPHSCVKYARYIERHFAVRTVGPLCIYHSGIQLYVHVQDAASAKDALVLTNKGAYMEQNKTYSDMSM